ncbi:unnamed protein product [Adineta steineri]|uniref:K Homology domain-containing protein n=1 Tax=Adineta steineri TaxID=433720 RepID=A0A814RBV5_9BILA|nr:unnamed protein product [Adineta steineri]
MQNSPVSFQDAVARARQIAQKLTGSAPNANANPSLKRPNSEDEYSNKRPAFTSPTQSNDIPTPVLRAQQIAQQINSQLGVKTSSDSLALPLSNQNTFQEDYKIPDKFVGLVIGKGGEQIVRLQAESGCKVQICQTRSDPIPGGPNPPDRLANLSGSREAIERAKRIMDDIILKGRMTDVGSVGVNPYSMGGGGGGGGSKSVDVMLPSAKCGLVIGKGGETIKRLSEEFGVKMYVVQDSADVDGIEHKPLRIMGEPDRIERVKQYVLETLLKPGGIPNPANRLGNNPTNPTSFNDYGSRSGGTPMSGPCNEAIYHVPYEKAGIIIGKGGESIKEINRKSGAFVELDKGHIPPIGNSSDRVFKLRGTPDQIVKAQQLMYEKVVNSPGGTGDMLSPAQFQANFNLPSAGINSSDSWNGNNDQYGGGSNNGDPYNQWANAYGQWPQANSYDQSSSNNNDSSAAAANNPAGMGQMDPAWLAYYQSMSYYNMMQTNMTGNPSSGTSTTTTTTKPTDSTANTSNTNSTPSATNSTAGQADYTQQWIEYYRSMGQNEYADQIAQQMKQPGSTTTNSSSTSSTTDPNQAAALMMSAGGGGDAWAAYAQQWANAAKSNSTNGNNS